MTPGEVTDKWGKTKAEKHSSKHFLYLSTSESEESLSSDLEAEEEQDREGRDGGEERVNHTEGRTGLLERM